MGWASGSDLLGQMINLVEYYKDSLPAKKVGMYMDMIEAFEDHDCDTVEECLGKSKDFDKAFKRLYPEEFEEDSEG